ncbi:NAD(P)H-dependent oxidoreductase [Cellulomonas sp. ATA003]|uniref:NAD(P)H-dependent oxidoreductase n=1 Tax=Cellulomonas sp. ATA003 TaxID=3073064 RepID=UPI0028738284|nr:NAD(P)H-dependent oxidoreductase [Cellulomonas sp. ATA003]WNB85405.1 NAD(P)H-dependent oxidoreductase [Cellulomonas sp. ATA003]
MSRPLQVVVVNGSPRTEGSKTMGLAGLVTDTLADLLPIEVRRVDVYGLGPSFTGAVGREDVDAVVEEQIRAVETADLLIPAVPVYRGSYPGMFKHLFDLVDQYALANKPVLLVATGGTERHALVLEHQLRPLFGFFQALTVPVGFYAAAGSFDGALVLDPEVYSRVEVGLADVVDLLRARVAAA